LGISAKTAYYLLLSFFPLTLLLLSAVSKTNIRIFNYIFPPFVIKILEEVMKISPDIKITTISFIIVLWSASTSIWALMDGIHLAYTGRMHDKLKNGRLRALIFTIFLMIFAFICVSLTFLTALDLSHFASERLNYFTIKAFHISIVIIVIFLFIISLYAMTPYVKIKIGKIYIGVILTAISWLISTWSFEIYIKMFSNYSTLYGSVGAFLGLALWLYVVTLVLFLGAELNAMLSENSKNRKK